MTARDPLVVVGSGASGVQFAQTALELGRRVLMLDVGRPKPPAPFPGDGLSTLKRKLDDPVRWFLGDDFEALILPDDDKEYYGFPPSKNHVFDVPASERARGDGFEALASFAAGGLAEAWTGGSYPFNDADLEGWPLTAGDLAPHYAAVARRIGVTGVRDDMESFFPWHDGLASPVELDVHAERLLGAYGARRAKLNSRGFFMGRARLAVLTEDRGSRQACTKLGRCLWGCPRDALWVPSLTLAELRGHAGFTYVPNVVVSHFESDLEGRVSVVVGRDATSGAERRFDVGALALAAGTLQTARIVLESRRRDGESEPRLHGLMDNRQVLMPFVSPALFGVRHAAESYQYHQLAVALRNGPRGEHVHGLITTLKTALIHPIVAGLPIDLRSALRLFRDAHSALGLMNVNLADRRREDNVLTLEPMEGGGQRLVVRYRPPADEATSLAAVSKAFRARLRDLGCLAPSRLAHVRPMGASVHYAGTIPMSVAAGPLTATAECRSGVHDNLHFVDGTTFPSLPAKNLTFTLMANATRVAAAICG